jgi:hypothetical protein
MKYSYFQLEYLVTPLILGSVSSSQFLMHGNPTGNLQMSKRGQRRKPILRPAAA